ncbi:MAG: TIGR02206 family membrane protein [Verrucomicrobiaceae bacterium]|nr:TIGR02206 family membrane protein [Verrucomicrobiaceae bacterium]
MPPAPPAFHPWSTPHQIVLLFVAVLLVLMLILARTRHRAAAERVLGVIMLTLWPASVTIHATCGSLTAQTLLPLQYCDVAGIAGGLALCTRRPFCCEVLYFFGLAGTLQGLLTPSLAYGFPDPRFFLFFAMHGLVPMAAIYTVTAPLHRPRPGSVWAVYAFSLGWFAITAVVNAALGTNYAFQCAKPAHASLFDHLGPVPWHNISAMLLGLVIYSLLALPFGLRRKG